MPLKDPKKAAEYMRLWRSKNQDTERAKARTRSKTNRNKKRELVRSFKTESPCKDCKVKYPHYVMDFDHVPERGPKKFNLASGHAGEWSDQSLKEEIAKCDLVCSNCHRERTWRRSKLA